MGCDIHIYAETRKDSTSPWQQIIEPVFKSCYHDPNEPDEGFNKKMTIDPYNGRNYDLFAILADVRNGRGFAGVKTGEGFNIISEPKGIPMDICEDVMSEYTVEVGEDYSFAQLQSWVNRNKSEWIKFAHSVSCPDWHSASWLALSELLTFDWDQFTMKRGTLSFEKYKSYKNSDSIPDDYSGSVWGGGTVTIDEDDADKILNGADSPAPLNKLYVNCHWPEIYRSTCQWFLENTVEVLKTLGDPDNVRIVFWFDN